MQELSVRGVRVALVGLCIALAAGECFAQKAPWDDYSVYMKRAAEVAPTPVEGALGEQVDLYTGQLSFSVSDIDLKGNNELPVRLARRYQIRDARESGFDPFADWELDVPYITGVFALNYTGDAGTSHHTWGGARCSGERKPPVIALLYYPNEYWYGLNVNVPNGGELLEPALGAPSPEGGPYRWVTSKFTWLSCLSSVENSAGEGFHARTPDGLKYWFNWMAVYPVQQLDKTTLGYDVGGDTFPIENVLTRRRHVLYATRVEDRFGNWVNYNYSNDENSVGRLNFIESSDGRRIDLNYDSAGRISSAVTAGRVWSYEYGNAALTPYLSSVVQPDGSAWTYEFSQFRSALAINNVEDATCSYPTFWAPPLHPEAYDALTGAVTAPSGVRAEFRLEARLHGRTNVPRICLSNGEGLSGYPEIGTYSDYVRMYWAYSLVQKTVTGPGLDELIWNYNYINSFSLADLPSLAPGINPSPTLVGSWANGGDYNQPEPACVSEACAGRMATEISGPEGYWARHTFGNSYRYDERKLIKVEIGTGPESILRTEDYKYDLRASGTTFPAPVGFSYQYKGDSYTESFIRPLREKVVTQDGTAFSWSVDSFDVFGRPTVTTSSSP